MKRIAGYLQNYAWGVPGGLQGWCPAGIGADAIDSQRPEAELWFGAHRNGPSALLDHDGESLADVVDDDDVPLLIKILAAAQPLSIQIHPPMDQAQASYARQVADPNLPKLLTDTLAKTEMLIAIEPFSVLAGFRAPTLAAAILRQTTDLAHPAADLLDEGNIVGAIEALLAIDPAQLGDLREPLLEAANQAKLSHSAIEALTSVLDNYPGDRGVLVSVLLDQRVLAAGEAVYVPAGVVHAYVRGTGVEVMTASDNVLRLGLTPKAIAVEQALAAVDQELQPEFLAPAAIEVGGGASVRTYAPVGAPFSVQAVSEGSAVITAGAYRLVLAVAGQASVASDSHTLNLDQGQAVAVLADDPEITVTTSGVAYVTREQAIHEH